MSMVQAFAPDDETLGYGAVQLPERRWTPGAVGCLDGPGNLGPESAGALTLVFGSFSDPGKAQRSYRRFTDAQRGVRDAPGFLRWFSFVDGPHGYGLGWWRSPDDAAAFARGQLHRELVREQRAEGLEYSQFAGIWTAHTIGRRNFYCPTCKSVTAAPAAACSGCGAALDDGFSA
jgi:heme-degrading monooxygenase HmoA